jgi:hypothetical protein
LLLALTCAKVLGLYEGKGPRGRLFTSRESFGIGAAPAVLHIDYAPVADGQHLVAASAFVSMLGCLG